MITNTARHFQVRPLACCGCTVRKRLHFDGLPKSLNLYFLKRRKFTTAAERVLSRITHSFTTISFFHHRNPTRFCFRGRFVFFSLFSCSKHRSAAFTMFIYYFLRKYSPAINDRRITQRRNKEIPSNSSKKSHSEPITIEALND